MVGDLIDGTTSSTARSCSSLTFSLIRTRPSARSAPRRSVVMSSMAARFVGSPADARLAIRSTSDSRSVSMTLMPWARSVLPVSVTSTMASTISGTFASVAPCDHTTRTGMPRSWKYRRVRFTYSVEMRESAGSSFALLAGWSPGTASTIRTPRPAPLFAYSSEARTSTSAPISSIQSRPVMPRSNNPSWRYVGISCGRRSETRSMRSSSTVPWESRGEPRRTCRSAASSSRRVCSSSEPLGMTRRSITAPGGSSFAGPGGRPGQSGGPGRAGRHRRSPPGPPPRAGRGRWSRPCATARFANGSRTRSCPRSGSAPPIPGSSRPSSAPLRSRRPGRWPGAGLDRRMSARRVPPVPSQPHWDPLSGQTLLDLTDGDLAGVEPGRGEHRIGPSLGEGLGEMLDRSRSPAGHDRHGHCCGHRLKEFQVVALSGPVAVHRRQQDLAGPAGLRGLDRPLNGVALGRRAARLDNDPPPMAVPPLRVDRHDHALGTEPVRASGQEGGLANGGGVQRDLVRAGPEQCPNVLLAAHTSTDGERDEHLLGGSRDHVERRPPTLDRRRDVEEHQLVATLRVVPRREFHGVARVTEVLEPNALHHPAGIDVETGDDPLGQGHPRTTSPSCNVSE